MVACYAEEVFNRLVLFQNPPQVKHHSKTPGPWYAPGEKVFIIFRVCPVDRLEEFVCIHRRPSDQYSQPTYKGFKMSKKYCQTHRVNESEAAVRHGRRDLGIQMHPSPRCRRSVFTIGWRALILCTCLASLSGEASAQHPAHCEEENLQPILSNGDFDGDGTVTNFDVRLISNHVESGEYAAFFDLNADRILDGQDVSLTARGIGDSSTLLDQQFTAVFWSTERYRDVNNAIADGYRPFTPILEGHGMHYAKLPFLATPSGLDPDYENILDGHANVHEPEGLNYDENGNLVAVFYYHGIDVKNWVFANQRGDETTIQALFHQSVHMSALSAASGGIYPQLYDSDEAIWHQHWGPCWDGLDYVQMAFDPTIVPGFDQHMLPDECVLQGELTGRRQGWAPAFNMLHVWLYKLNPCGVFAGIHPHVSVGFPEEPIARPLPQWFEIMGIDNPYEDGAHH